MAESFKRCGRLAVALVIMVGLAACAHGNKKAVSPGASAEAYVPPTVEQRERELRDTVAQQLTAANQAQAEQGQKIVHRTPYYFRQYSVYPESADFDVMMQEKESRSTPFVADVTVPVQRFVTGLHRSREEAAQDGDFLRETGVETVTYEFRNGHWVRVGSMFVAERTEQNIDGSWTRVQPRVQRTIPQEEEKGFFGRLWSKIAG